MILVVSSIGRGDAIRSPSVHAIHLDDHDHDASPRRRQGNPATAVYDDASTPRRIEASNSFCGPSWDTATCSLDSHCETHSDCDANSGHFCQTNVPDCDVNDLLAEALLGPGSLAGTGQDGDEAVDGGSTTTIASATTSTTSDDPSDHRFCGGDYTSAVASCSLETHCPNGTDVECPPGSYCYSYLDSCNARDMMSGGGNNVTDGDVASNSNSNSNSTWTEEGTSSNRRRRHRRRRR